MLGAAKERLGPLFSEIGHTFAPFLIANAAATAAGEESFETEIDGRAWTQPTFLYQEKCLAWIRKQFAALGEMQQQAARKILAGTACKALVG